MHSEYHHSDHDRQHLLRRSTDDSEKLETELALVYTPLATGICWGVIAWLTFECIPLLVKRAHTAREAKSRSWLWFYIAYVAIMFCLGTLFVVCYAIPPQLYLASFVAAGMAMLYAVSEPGERQVHSSGLMRTVLNNDRVSGLLCMITYSLPNPALTHVIQWATAVSRWYFFMATFLNLGATSLMVVRLRAERRFVRSMMGYTNLNYTGIIAMMIESCTLVTLCSITYLIVSFIDSPFCLLVIATIDEVQAIGPHHLMFWWSEGGGSIWNECVISSTYYAVFERDSEPRVHQI
ncbi:hypothetical protein CONPUDRAFT_147512 [Coniophora puteana RWD-64-598 SS2]|uniref:Uncharacterized protein n=1 Tax=Coniophora puteana (strain RWD-64-598) TaxID=741705 RepID=A0A5M3M840_CONPW|nr:uncharacterized protein CONPUDRAFT_147512 [Coniophora puteana RWD-64-598 SS2]EIW74960.1 hypothetical protein CONPUDRAFT_147512 [Coniophora puteana RWD-64-598 SS2]